MYQSCYLHQCLRARIREIMTWNRWHHHNQIYIDDNIKRKSPIIGIKSHTHLIKTNKKIAHLRLCIAITTTYYSLPFAFFGTLHNFTCASSHKTTSKQTKIISQPDIFSHIQTTLLSFLYSAHKMKTSSVGSVNDISNAVQQCLQIKSHSIASFVWSLLGNVNGRTKCGDCLCVCDIDFVSLPKQSLANSSIFFKKHRYYPQQQPKTESEHNKMI